MAAASAERLLTLDRGNSTLDCMLGGPGGASQRCRLDPTDAPGLRAFLAPAPPVAAVACSVVAADGLATARAVLTDAGVPLALAGDDLPCPLALDYPEPATLGVDRWVAALAAQREVGTAVVVDCGTAITVDLVTAEGRFLGGSIAPGLRAMARGLAMGAPALPAFDEQDLDPAAVPVTSAEAVRSGVWRSFCGAVERLVTDAATLAPGFSDAPVVLTGGDADLYVRHGRLACHCVPDLVHRGLRHLWAAAAR